MEQKDNNAIAPLLSSEPEDKSLTSQVLEYYHRYSSSRELPKYFSGTASSSFKTGGAWHMPSTSRTAFDSGKATRVIADRTTVAVNTEPIIEQETVAVNTEESIKPFVSPGGRPLQIGQENLPEPPQILVENVCPVSPASSVASNRKLEWDNGADIGYNNARAQKVLQKSVSLPVLSSLECNDKTVREKTKSKQFNCDRFNSDLYGNRPYSSSTTDSVPSVKKNYSSSTSSSSNRLFSHNSSSSSKSETSESILSFLKKKIGLPVAESTPVIEESVPKEHVGSETPRTTKFVTNESPSGSNKLKKSNSCENLQSPRTELEADLKKACSQVDLNMVDQVSHYKNLKVLKLSISKPVTVECVASTSHRTQFNTKSGEDKFIQTSLPRNTSIAVQTDLDSSRMQPEQMKKSERQSVIYICHTDSQEEPNIVHSSAGTQSNSDVLSNRCNSFEYLYGEEYDRQIVTEQPNSREKSSPEGNSPTEAVESEIPRVTHNIVLGNLKRCPPKTNLTSISSSNENTEGSTSKESPLAQSDLESNLSLLKKVMKSKKYDDKTKKFYLKRIIQKILEAKTTFTEDSSRASCNSLPDLSPDKDTSGSCSKSPPNLQENKPWVPVPQLPPRTRNLQMQTFTDELLPEPGPSKFVPIQVVKDRRNRLQRNPLFTLTDKGLLLTTDCKEAETGGNGDSSNSIANELYEAFQEPPPTVSSSSDRTGWRELKTKSEALFEQRTKTKGDDHLVRFARKEREHQLGWINDEISHLNKLKKLLEPREESSTKILRTITQKPHVDDMKGIKRATTVYIVTTERSSDSSSKYSSNNEELKFTVCNRATCKNPKCPARYVRPVSAASSRSKSPQEIPGPSICTQKVCRPATPSCRAPCSLENPSVSVDRDENVISVGDERINLNKARLVSSEQFAADNGNSKATVRRYTFEVSEEKPPVEVRKSVTPTNARRLSCELVVTDEISQDKNPVSCGTSPIPCPPECDKKICECANKVTQTHDLGGKCVTSECGSVSSSSSSSSSSFSSSKSVATNLCRCCKRKYVKGPKKQMNSEGENRPRYILCHPCYNQSLKMNCMDATRPYYTYPGHVCQCYNGTMQFGAIVPQMQSTIAELRDLESKNDDADVYCRCRRARKHSSSDRCCQDCGCKLRKKGIAYVLTLESSDEHKRRKKHTRRQPSLQEIKITVPSPRRKGGRIKTCSSGNSTEDHHDRSGDRNKKKKKPTLQEYLSANKPEFVASAEQRRTCLIDLAYMREKRCQKYKQLLALTGGIALQTLNDGTDGAKPKRVFSPEEMKKITEKNYKKLPEVQQKLIDNREKQIRKANKLLADIFNQKLRRQVLKGKHTIPPNDSIIKLV